MNDVSITLNNNDCIGILGENGVGKTTLLKCISNIIIPDDGPLLMNNVSAVLEGNRNIYWRLTLRENVEYFLSLKKIRFRDEISIFNEYLKMFKIQKYVDTQVRFLSRGTQQKIAIIIALMQNPQLLILDEPTLGLDVSSKAELINILKELKLKREIYIMISSHDLNFIEELCNRIFILENTCLFELTNLNSLNFINNSFIIYTEEAISDTPKELDIISKDKNKIEINYISQEQMIESLNVLNKLGYTIKKISVDTSSLTNIYKNILNERGNK